jgi:hypothetical protein
LEPRMAISVGDNEMAFFTRLFNVVQV